MSPIDASKESGQTVNNPIGPVARPGHNKEDSLSSSHGTGLGRRRGFRRHTRGTSSPSGSISRTRRRNRGSEINNSNDPEGGYEDRISDSGSTESSPNVSRSNSRKSRSSRPNSEHFGSFISADDNTLEAVPITPYDLRPKNPYINEEF